MATKKLAFIDQVILELERIATEADLPFFVDDRHNARYGGDTIQIGHVTAGPSLRETTVAVKYEIQRGVAHFSFLGPLTSAEFALRPGDDVAMVEFLDTWEEVADGTREAEYRRRLSEPWPVAPPDFGQTEQLPKHGESPSAGT